MGADPVTVFLGGDVMLGRGVDQILPHPGRTALREIGVRDARGYVDLAEAAHGPVPRPAAFDWPWGEALTALDDAAPDARVVNLETAVTRDGTFAPDKGVHYRMNPANLPCLAAARPDVCVLANNHVLDFGRRGLHDTLDALAAAGLTAAGAGRSARTAARPASVPLRTGGRLLVFAAGLPSSGIPPGWAGTAARGGVHLVPRAAPSAAAGLTRAVQDAKRPGDVVVVSLHWGANWDWHVSDADVHLAHALVDAGADIVHGHSSHHPRPLEVYRGRLVLYGCGDLVDDYEGIGGHEEYRDDLRLLYLVSVRPESGRLAGARMVPLRARRMRLERAGAADAEWLRRALGGAGRDFGVRVGREADGVLTLRP